MTRVLFT